MVFSKMTMKIPFFTGVFHGHFGIMPGWLNAGHSNHVLQDS